MFNVQLLGYESAMIMKMEDYTHLLILSRTRLHVHLYCLAVQSGVTSSG